MYMLPSDTILLMENRQGFNNKILVSEHGFKICVNKLVNLVPTVPKEVSKKALKETTAPKGASKTVSKAASKSQPITLPYKERVLLQEQKDEIMTVSVLLTATSLVFVYFFK